MHASDGMMKPGVMCSWIYQIGKPHLRNSPKSLKIRMSYDLEDKRIWYSNKSVNWIVEYFKLVLFFQIQIFKRFKVQSYANEIRDFLVIVD